ncbi:putative RNA-directed DNA polymerase from transposon BS [Trichonephila clavipes]|nr:putative RNA-directed DNA polymerase from transposon BS [Trichonephila clavipes]
MVTEKAMERLIRSCIFSREFGMHRIRNPPTTQRQPYWICTGAFDRVWRQLLITKLHDYFSLREKALPWISDSLWNRSIRVKYNKCLSDPFAIRQGVPQGSVLSPVLFSLYITGIEKVLAKHCEVGIFADIIVWSSGSDVGENELKLNRDMEEAYSFAEMHKLIFNASKFLTTFFSTNRHLFNYQPKISMN